MRLPLLPAAAAAVCGLLLPLALTAGPADAAPTCTGRIPLSVCGGRVVAEPETSTTFHQYDGPGESLRASLEAIEARSPRFLEAGPISEFTGNAAHRSAGGRDLWVVRITDERVPRAGKKQVAGSLSVHGLEAAGREGGLRYIEDLAVWTAALAAGGEDRTLYAGDVEVRAVAGHGADRELVRLPEPRRVGGRRPDQHDPRRLPARQRRRCGPQPRLRDGRLVRPRRRPRHRGVRAGDPRVDLAGQELPGPGHLDRRARRADHPQRGLLGPHHPGRAVDADPAAAGQAAR